MPSSNRKSGKGTGDSDFIRGLANLSNGFLDKRGRDAHDAHPAPFIFRLAFADYRPSAAVSAAKRPLLAAKDTPMPTPGYWRVKALPAISSPEAYRPSTA